MTTWITFRIVLFNINSRNCALYVQSYKRKVHLRSQYIYIYIYMCETRNVVCPIIHCETSCRCMRHSIMDSSSTLPRGFATGNVLDPSIAVSQLRIRLIDRYSTGFSGSIPCMMQQGPRLNRDVVGIKRPAIIDFLHGWHIESQEFITRWIFRRRYSRARCIEKTAFAFRINFKRWSFMDFRMNYINNVAPFGEITNNTEHC